ncbi:AMP-binding protein [Amycolatopsis mediterranei]|uniref:AMP-binding protein n=1 Tax=Amycolatopsis mediterranei TaxID=33910 RepID=UPI00342CBB76
MTSRTLYSWFAETVCRHGDVAALELPGFSLTYRELDDLACRVAGEVVAAHGGVPATVGIPATRDLVAYVGYLAVARLGATAVPVNPAHPITRTALVAASARLDLMITAAARPQLPGVTSVPLAGRLRTLDRTPLPAPPDDPEAVAYLLFTSGSTGTPKGVPIRGVNVSPYLCHVIDRYGLGPGCRTSHTFELTFDVSVFDLFASWGAGATLVVPDTRTDLVNPVGYVTGRRLTHWFSVPSVVSLAARLRLLRAGSMPDLRHSIFAGDRLTVEQADAWATAAPGSTIDNLYGPTEMTVTCTGYRLPAERADWPETSNGTVPIGRPYPHVEHRVTGDGELLLRGAQRFAGYLDPDDDAGRFDPPVAPGTVRKSHWYRTGDRVRVEQGELVHIGRLDQQVKIRGGYRVELGEVETAVRAHPGVADAVVIAVAAPNAEVDLVAVYVGAEAAETELYEHVARLLPAYMVPRRYHRVPDLPRNANGKTDRRRLTELVG